MRPLKPLLSLVVFASMALHQPLPRELSDLTAKARLEGPVARWCRAEFRAGHSGAYAVAVSATGGGHYLALEPDGAVHSLATFEGPPDISCYTRAEAEQLDVTIEGSQTVHGDLRPRWDTAVVCGFVDATTAVCWQYSPADRAFVEVGRWIT